MLANCPSLCVGCTETVEEEGLWTGQLPAPKTAALTVAAIAVPSGFAPQAHCAKSCCVIAVTV